MKILLTPLLLLLSYTLCAQSSEYFQQEVSYRIEVELDDEVHRLSGYLSLDYTNRAPHALDTLYFHLWPNAYRNDETAFARQLRRRGEAEFLFADQADRGYIDSLDFRINGEAVRWQLHPDHPDIAWLTLKKPVQPEQTITVTTPFRVQLPKVFSRLGYEEGSYQITQWYPKPAVYDRDGWHPMPYLDIGEFYSEFGRYEVSITLPKAYVVAATGTLQTPSEQDFLAQLLETGKMAPFRKGQKTITYTAERVHDFAWFANPEFLVRKDTLQQSDGGTVDCWAFFPPEEADIWEEATFYTKRALQFYGQRVGAYPYPQATVVAAPLGAGGGMEYPMITNCDAGSTQGLDELIAHEVGHNWFYGILATNERTHPWMDEGMNSYYDHAYSRAYYGEQGLGFLPDALFKKTNITLFRLAYLYHARRCIHQAPDTHADSLSEINYFLSAYEVPAQAFYYLEQYVGKANMDRAMQAYYQQWQFRHPSPEDFRQVMEAELEYLPWLFDGLLYSNGRLDYALLRTVPQGDSLAVWLENRGDINGPVPLAAMIGDSVVHQQWVSGFGGQRKVVIPSGTYTDIVLDPDQITLDVMRANNYLHLDAPIARWSLPRLGWLTGIEDDNRSNLFIAPALAWNTYDRLMTGLLLYNHSLLERPFEWVAMPTYAWGSNSLTGLGEARYNFYPNGNVIRKWTMSLNARRFHYEDLNLQDIGGLDYQRLEPKLSFFWVSPDGSTHERELSVRGILLREQQPTFSPDGVFDGKEYQQRFIQELRYTDERRQSVDGGRWSVAVEHQFINRGVFEDARYVKASFSWLRNFHYGEGKYFQARFFGGGFLYNTEREAGFVAPWAFNLISQGYNDYRYDDLYFGRYENSGWTGQQISRRDGNFKTPIPQGFNIGRSNSFILALNFKASLPPKIFPNLPIKAYLDLGYYEDASPLGADLVFADQLLWSGGLMLDLFDEAIAVYFPIASGESIQNRLLEKGNYWRRIGFQVDLQRLNPWRGVERLDF